MEPTLMAIQSIKYGLNLDTDSVECIVLVKDDITGSLLEVRISDYYLKKVLRKYKAQDMSNLVGLSIEVYRISDSAGYSY